VTGRRGRWATISVWAALAAVGVVLHGHLDDVTSAGQSSFLPAHSQSTRVVHLLKTRLHGGENIPLFIVFERRRGLTRADRVTIGQSTGSRIPQDGLASRSNLRAAAVSRTAVDYLRRSGQYRTLP
jgi:uncharacterized membrane protein YdfJ with MMPL/SSD domain